MELVDFLRARLDEDEAAAKAATAGPWSVNDESYAESISAVDGTEVVAGGRWGGDASVFESTEDAVHIARHDPARVLAEVEAKREILDRCGWAVVNGGGSAFVGPVLCLLARPFRTHPDFDPDWLED